MDKNSDKIIFSSMAAVLMVAMFMTGCAQKPHNTKVSKAAEAEITIEINRMAEPETISVGTDGEKAGIAPDDVNDAPKQRKTITIENVGRSDPFTLEVGDYDSGYYITSEMIGPPENMVENSDAVNVINTKVTGILYDKLTPSAIINIQNSDYLVRPGDYINNYKVLSIGQKNVTVQLGTNVYKAGVGELFTLSNLNQNTVYNLENKFGGSKRQ